jgi:two-component system, OmpR family, alkaline phosphatase synthesis response regulator PhoP
MKAAGVTMETILLVEDDPAILLGLKKNLRYHGYDVMVATDGAQGLELAIDKKPDVIILDVMLPTMSGFEICKTLKRNEIEIPIIIVSAKDQEIDKIMGLDLGADDYMTKPFSIGELVARINAVLRRQRRFDKKIETYEFAHVVVDFTGRSVEVGDKTVDLSPREFDLLAFFIKHAGQVLERQQILNRVWGFDYYGTARTIDNFVTKLRQKMEERPEKPKHFLTVRGVGYKFMA